MDTRERRTFYSIRHGEQAVFRRCALISELYLSCIDTIMCVEAARTFQLDGKLGPYPHNHYRTWQQLSKYITLSVLKVKPSYDFTFRMVPDVVLNLQRCEIVPDMIILPGDSTPNRSQSLSPPSTEVDTDGASQSSPNTPSFTRISIRKAGLAGKECTSYYMDRR